MEQPKKKKTIQGFSEYLNKKGFNFKKISVVLK